MEKNIISRFARIQSKGDKELLGRLEPLEE
jgi:hypothetical protein